MFTIKARSIAQSDIKSVSVKKALISAGLYFNADGKLVKKEKAIKEDTNGDGKIDHNDGRVSTNIFTGLRDAVKEFIVIANADFSGNEKENKETFDETISSADLKETAEGLDELENQMKDKLNLTKADGVDPEADEEEEEEIEEKPKKLAFIKTWITSNFTIGRIKNTESEENEEIYDDEEDEEEEIGENEMDIIENNLDEDAETDLTDTFDTEEVKSVIVEVVEDIPKVNHNTQPKAAPTSEKKVVIRRDAAVNDYLNRMRGNK